MVFAKEISSFFEKKMESFVEKKGVPKVTLNIKSSVFKQGLYVSAVNRKVCINLQTFVAYAAPKFFYKRETNEERDGRLKRE